VRDIAEVGLDCDVLRGHDGPASEPLHPSAQCIEVWLRVGEGSVTVYASIVPRDVIKLTDMPPAVRLKAVNRELAVPVSTG
jgi:hypothetical protein